MNYSIPVKLLGDQDEDSDWIPSLNNKWSPQIKQFKKWERKSFQRPKHILRDLKGGIRNNMANKDGTGPRSGSQGPRDGRGKGQGRAGGIGVGKKTGGKKGNC